MCQSFGAQPLNGGRQSDGPSKGWWYWLDWRSLPLGIDGLLRDCKFVDMIASFDHVFLGIVAGERAAYAGVTFALCRGTRW